MELRYKQVGPLYVSGKLLTYPSPDPTFCPKGKVRVNVGLWEGDSRSVRSRFMTKSFPGKKGHPPSRVRLSKRSGGPSFRAFPKKKKKKKRTANRRLSWLWMDVRVNRLEIEKKRGEVWLHKISNLQNYEIRWHLHIGSLLCFERFSTPVFPSPRKPTFQNSNSTRNQGDEEPLSGCAAYKLLFIVYYFI